ncbi:MAG: DUF3667 domain-containing protein [Rhizobacter sp.]|nr:DUF3667 domain-containing protein [Ferruginibacter sp.]
MANFFHEGFHAVTHTDKGLFHLLKSLAIKPGTTAREYIQGKRKRYFSPFTFFLILMTIFVLSNTYFLKERKVIEPSTKVLQHIPTEEGKKKYMATIGRVNTSQNFFRKHGNIVAMIAVPVISFFTWLFFRRKKFNYAEHLTANMMFVAFSNLVFTVIIFPLAGLLKPGLSAYFTGIAILLQVIYFTWALNGFLQLTTTGQRTKSFFVCLLAIFSWSLLSITSMAVYVYQDWNFYEFFTRMKG